MSTTVAQSKASALRQLKIALESGPLSIEDILGEFTKKFAGHSEHKRVFRSIRTLSGLSDRKLIDITRLVAIAWNKDNEATIVSLDRKSAREATARLAGTEREDDLSPAEAAEILDISRTHLRHLMDDGLVKFHTVGTHHRIKRSEIDRLKQHWDSRAKGLAEMDAISQDIGT